MSRVCYYINFFLYHHHHHYVYITVAQSFHFLITIIINKANIFDDDDDDYTDYTQCLPSFFCFVCFTKFLFVLYFKLINKQILKKKSREE